MSVAQPEANERTNGHSTEAPAMVEYSEAVERQTRTGFPGRRTRFFVTSRAHMGTSYGRAAFSFNADCITENNDCNAPAWPEFRGDMAAVLI